MHWLAVVLAISEVTQGPPARPLRFDFSTVPQTRDSFTYFRNGVARGYSLRSSAMVHSGAGVQVVYEAFSEERRGIAEYMRVAVDSATGAPIAFYKRTARHMTLPTPRDTIMAAINVRVESSVVTGDWCIWTALGDKSCVPVRTALPPGAVWRSAYVFGAAALTAAPGDSLTGAAYYELGDSVETLMVVAEAPESLDVAAGRFEVLPLRFGAWRIFVTRAAPRHTVREQTLDAVDRLDLAGGAEKSYVDAATVDEGPTLLHSGALTFPENARKAGVQGRVLVECVLDTTGHVESGSIRIIDTPDPRFEQPAKDFLLSADFRPGRVRGRAVRVLVRIPIDFTLSLR